MIGFFNVLKPVGYSSGSVVASVRRFLISNGYITKSTKVGHMGTLDPGGTGVLPIAVGKATRLFDYFGDKVKSYRAEFVFGKETDTLDSYGRTTAKGRDVTGDEIRLAASRLLGTISQLPPQFSAKSVGGVRAYDLARQGKAVELKPATVTIYSLDVVSVSGSRAVVDVTCSAGTYVRSIARDMAALMDTVGYMSYIIRTASGAFRLEDAVTVGELSPEVLVPVDEVVRLPYVDDLTEKEAYYLKNGLPRRSEREDGLYYVREGGVIIGIAEQKDGYLTYRTRLDD